MGCVLCETNAYICRTKSNNAKAKTTTMKTVITKDGYTLIVGDVYPKGAKFYGKVAVWQGDKSGQRSRFDVDYFNSIVEDKDKI